MAEAARTTRTRRPAGPGARIADTAAPEVYLADSNSAHTPRRRPPAVWVDRRRRRRAGATGPGARRRPSGDGVRRPRRSPRLPGLSGQRIAHGFAVGRDAEPALERQRPLLEQDGGAVDGPQASACRGAYPSGAVVAIH